jgi:riboflavin synthase
VRYVVEKGSIAIEGTSLTVARIAAADVTIAVIPHTYTVTNLHTLTPGSPVNIEVDVMAKYAERLAASPAETEKPFELTVEYLIANGY